MLFPLVFCRSRLLGQCIHLIFCHYFETQLKKNLAVDLFFCFFFSLFCFSFALLCLSCSHSLCLTQFHANALGQSHPSVSASLALNKISAAESEVENIALPVISHCNEATDGEWTGFSGLSCAVSFIDLSAGCCWAALRSALSSGRAVSCAVFQAVLSYSSCLSQLPSMGSGLTNSPGTAGCTCSFAIAQSMEGLLAMAT